jgi:Ankyrin repeat
MGPAHLELLVELLHLGGNASLPDELGNTPLHAAANSSNVAAIKLLKLAGASTSVVNSEGETPLDRLLARQKSSADFASTFGTPAGFAAKSDLRSKSEAIQLLLPPDQSAQLIGGAVTPRMVWYLRTCGEIVHDYTCDIVDFHLFVPPSVLRRLPRGRISGKYQRGMDTVLGACIKLLYEKTMLSVSAVPTKALGGAGWSSVRSMLDVGLKVEFVLDYLFYPGMGPRSHSRRARGILVWTKVNRSRNNSRR